MGVELKKRDVSGLVHSCSIPGLLRDLCASFLTHSMVRPSSVIDFCFHKPIKRAFLQDSNRLNYLIRRLAGVCMDVILLRPWEWRTSEIHCTSHCLGVALTLHYQEHTTRAESLASAMTWLLQGNSDLTEADNVLQFLFLLSSPSVSASAEDSPMTREGQIYSFYPSTVFERPLDLKSAALNASVVMTTDLLDGLPGAGFTGFMTRAASDDCLKNQLFGGLTHSTSTDLNDPLGLPRLPSDHNALSLLPRGPAPMSSPTVLVPPTTPASCVPTWQAHSDMTLLASVIALKEEEGSLLHSWEGWNTSLPFLSDASTPAPRHAAYILTTKYAALAGLPSSPPSDPLCLPQLLEKAIDNLPYPPLQPVMHTDAILFSIYHSLHNLLISCRTSLLQSESTIPSLLQTEKATHCILPVTRFVLDLIQKNTEMEKFEVMDGLYRQCSLLQGTIHYFPFLSILSQALLSYFKTVEQWVYYGTLDTTQWIGIQADFSALERRDASYWTQGYVTTHMCTPSFLSHLSQPILTCGKALNLLRVCLPKHPLCTGQFQWPQLRVLFLQHELVEMETQCEAYRSEVSRCLLTISNQMKQEHHAEEERIHAKHLQARQDARREGERIRELERQQVTADAQRKHSLAMEQKEEIERVKALRSQHKEEEYRADMAYRASLEQQEQVLREKEAMLKHDVRKELEEQYQQLSEEAEQRKAHAQWRLARLELSSVRQAFWRKEKEENLADTTQEDLDGKPLLGTSSSSTSGPDAEMTATASHAPLSAAQDTKSHTPLSSEGHTPLPPQDSGDPQLVSTRGQAPPDTLSHTPQDTLGHTPQDSGDPQLVSTRGQAPQDTLGHTPQDSGDPQLVSTRGQAPQDTLGQTNLLIQDSRNSQLVSTRGQAPQDTLDHTPLPTQDTSDPRLVSTRGQAPQDTLGHTTQDTLGHALQDSGDPRLVSTRGQAPQDTLGHTLQDSGDPWLVSTRGQAPPSSIQYLLQQEVDSKGIIQDIGHPTLVSTRGRGPLSTVQNLFAVDTDDEGKVCESQASPHEDIPLPDTQKYRDDFSILNGPNSLHDVLQEVVSDCLTQCHLDLEFLKLFPLPSLLANSIELPLLTQCSLVNQSLLDYLTSQCQLHQHFLTLKRFLLLEDGEFGHALSTRLCEQLHYAGDWRRLCSPSFLNPLLTSSLEVSLHYHSVPSSHLSFTVKNQPHTIHTNAVKALDFLELNYKVAWPCNIIITSSSLHRYNKVLQFLLELKRSSWVLKQTFYWLKNCCVLNDLKIRQLQTYRHEFQHFVNIMHGYISSQLFGLTWEEFQTDLAQHSHTLDDVIHAHNKFIDGAIFRCLLSKKARPVMNLIYELLSSILTFSSHTQASAVTTFPEHNYTAMCSAYKGFRDTVRLLISVLGKLIARGYQPHLEELLLRLNFNSFY